MESTIVARFVRAHPGLLALHVVFVVTAPLIEAIAVPWIVAGLTERMRRPASAAVGRLTLLLCAAVAAIQVAQLLRDRTNRCLVPALDVHVKTTALDRVLRARGGCRPAGAGDAVYLLSVLSEMSSTWLAWVNDFALPYAATFGVTGVVLWRYDPVTGAGFVAFLAALGAAMALAPYRCLRRARAHSAAMADAHAQIEELLQNAETVRMYGTRRAETQRLRAALADDAGYRHYRAAGDCAVRWQALTVPLLALALAGFVLRSRALLRSGRTTHAAFVTALLMIVGLLSSVLWLMEIAGEMLMDLGHLANLADGLSDAADADGTGACPRRRAPPVPPPPPADAVIGLWRVTFTHAESRTPVLRDVTLRFRRGERTALVGPVGGGKSTALRLLAGFCAPDADGVGDAFLDGAWYADLGVAAVRRRVGYVPQTPVLFRGTTLHNVTYGAPPGTDPDAVRARVRAWAGPALADLLDADVGPMGRRLSGGQRQLVWCLRLLLHPPAVVLMDEPTASMDRATKDVLLRLLDALAAAATVVVVTHDPYLEARCDRIVRLDPPAAAAAPVRY